MQATTAEIPWSTHGVVRDCVGDVPFTSKTPINYICIVRRGRSKNIKIQNNTVPYFIFHVLTETHGNEDDPGGFEKYFFREA